MLTKHLTMRETTRLLMSQRGGFVYGIWSWMLEAMKKVCSEDAFMDIMCASIIHWCEILGWFIISNEFSESSNFVHREELCMDLRRNLTRTNDSEIQFLMEPQGKYPRLQMKPKFYVVRRCIQVPQKRIHFLMIETMFTVNIVLSRVCLSVLYTCRTDLQLYQTS